MAEENSFGQLIKQHRKVLALIQSELARRVGCATITLRKIEAEALRPSVQVAERLAMALSIPLEERANFVRLARTAGLQTPKQIRADPIRPQANIYCLDVVLYEMLTGRLPFEGPTPIDQLMRHLHETLPPLTFSSDGSYIVTAGFDNTARIWDASNGQELFSLEHESGIWGLAFSSD